MGAVGGEEAPGMERQPQNKKKTNGAILSTKNQAEDLPNIPRYPIQYPHIYENYSASGPHQRTFHLTPAAFLLSIPVFGSILAFPFFSIHQCCAFLPGQ